ncbi:MAG: FAD:protein FMN transferase [Lachnospiraceae bacterium]|nr:FAD:protein FMN transferase [Lachnospiraceae bacterium]
MIISQKAKRILPIPVILLIVALLLFPAFANRGKQGTLTRTGFFFDTMIEITVYDAGALSEDRRNEVLNGCMELCGRYERLFSRTRKDSDIWRINHAGGSPVTVDPETSSLISTALSFADESDGLVDPAIGTLSELWFPPGGRDTVPTEEEIREALLHTDRNSVIVSGSTVTLKDPETMIDLGFIAKGYVADRLKEYLESEGIKGALINLGGNILVTGKKPDNSPFRIGIRDPENKDGAPLESISITAGSVVSSGNYERYFEKDGIRYHHLLSVRTGYPAETGLSQVTVHTASSTEADALSTICFLLGFEDGKKFLSEHYPEASVIFTDGNGKILR